MHCRTVCEPSSSPAFLATQLRVSLAAARVTLRMPLLMALMQRPVSLAESCAEAREGSSSVSTIANGAKRFIKGVVFTMPPCFFPEFLTDM